MSGQVGSGRPNAGLAPRLPPGFVASEHRNVAQNVVTAVPM